MNRILTILALFLSSAAAAQDHLEPEHSVYGGRAFQDEVLIGYDLDVVRKFEELFAGDIGVRAIVLPPFETEYGLGVTFDRADPKLVGLRSGAMLWHYSILREYDSGKRPPDSRYAEKTRLQMRALRASIPPRIEDVELKRCQMPLSAVDQALLTDLWRTMLYVVRRPPAGRIGLDRVSYHYSGNFDQQTLAGQTWSPKEGTRLDGVTRMTEALYAACDANDADALSAAILDAEAICKEIDCSGE